MGFIGIFVPIYLLTLGYSFTFVILFLSVHHVTLLGASFVAAFISNRIGLVRVLQIRFIFLFVYLYLLSLLPEFPTLFFGIAILSGIESAFYWEPLNVFFVRNTEDKNTGTALGKLTAVSKIFGVITPVLSALIVVTYGFPALFLVGAFLMMLMMIPILPLSSEKTDFKFSWERTKEIYAKNKKYLVPELIDNLAEDAGVIWTIFIYLNLLSVLDIGLLGTAISLTGVLFVLTLGKINDTWDRKKLLRIGALLVTLTWVFNFIVGAYFPNALMFYIATVLMSFTLKIFLYPYGSFLYARARKDDVQFIVLREIPTVFGRLILFALAILFSENIPFLFLFVGLLFLYFQFFNPEE